MKEKKIAVVGGGVAGIVSAFLISKKYQVTLFEKASYLGGHTNTFLVQDELSNEWPVDTGFIVFNDKNYPFFSKFLEALDVPWRWSDMSFSYFNEKTNYQYAGTGLNGLFAQRGSLFSIQHWLLLKEIIRFGQVGSKALQDEDLQTQTLKEFLDRHRFGENLRSRYLIPMGASIWSTPQDRMLDYPAKSFLEFFKNHGLLSLKDRPRWRTVVGGSFSYVKKFKEVFNGSLRLATHVESVHRKPDGVEVRLLNSEPESFDYVVLATHADQTFRLLENPSDHEVRALSNWRYQKNEVVLHTDKSLMPSEPRAWASWNFLHQIGSRQDDPASLTYHMNRLQGLASPTQFFVTLNSRKPIDPAQVIRRIEYSHPTYDQHSPDAQKLIREVNGASQQVFFCGSYFGWGFHEDAVSSSVEMAKNLGVDWVN